MNSISTIILITFFLSAASSFRLIPTDLAKCVNPSTVKELNVTQYLGLWYNIAADNLVLSTFQTDYCVTAEYGLRSDGKVSVLNTQRDGSVSGPQENITGYAYQPDPVAYPGKLKVHLEGGSPGEAPYWVLQLGPIVNNQYSWVIVSDPICGFMWVLARTPSIDATTTKTIQDYLVSFGFTISTDWIPIVQTGCVY
eukprot:TRINITY_DN887_c0_g2_i2.p1 TRINITY_DN887_c0_g2~~TRINITY_DN887_c0_g2_i2.p1  ORF type:complete len:219 (-),score=63.86 TRINITY_DN887_c0_g2_i2:705-1292(-)